MKLRGNIYCLSVTPGTQKFEGKGIRLISFNPGAQSDIPRLRDNCQWERTETDQVGNTTLKLQSGLPDVKQNHLGEE